MRENQYTARRRGASTPNRAIAAALAAAAAQQVSDPSPTALAFIACAKRFAPTSARRSFGLLPLSVKLGVLAELQRHQ